MNIKLFESYHNDKKRYEFAYTCVSPTDEVELEAIIEHLDYEVNGVSQVYFMKLIPFDEINDVLPVTYANKQQFIKDYHVRCYVGSFYFDKYEDDNREYAEENGEEYDITQEGELINYAVIVNSGIEHVWKA